MSGSGTGDGDEPSAAEPSGHPSVVLVTGGTGTLGRRLVRQLRAAGHEVRVLSRSGAPGTLPGDLGTGAGVAEALAGADVVVHCASTPTRPKDVDVAGTRTC